jgi:hypothetical protein
MSRKSGKPFEEAFARYLESATGIQQTELRELMKGKVTARPWECDIHGVGRSPVYRALCIGASLIFLFGLTRLFVPTLFNDATAGLQDAGQGVETTIQSSLGYSVQGWGVAILGAALFYVGWSHLKKTTRHIWVECKDRKTSIKRTDVLKLVQAAEDVRANPQSKWSPTELWFAATCTFDQDALSVARDKGVRCFQAVDFAPDRAALEVTEL